MNSDAVNRDTSRIEPPAQRVVAAGVTEEPLDFSAITALVEDAAAGATVTFTGTVRNHDTGRAVSLIEYSCHPGAQEIVESIAREVCDRHGLDAIALMHRVGTLEIGQAALVCAASAAHRREAFDAAVEAVEEVKKRLPVWKKQVFPDGSHEWSGCA